MPQHPIHILHYVAVRHPDKPEAFAGEPVRPTQVIVELFSMSIAVDFDYQPRLRAEKVGNEWTKPNLTSEFCATQLARAEPRPKLALGRRCVAAGLADAS
jgi:hypothetical protein